MGEMVIAVYRPKPGQTETVHALVRAHVPYLRSLGLVSDRPALAMTAQDGTVLEIFEWRDGASERAHDMPEVLKVWGELAQVCDFPTLDQVPEAKRLFARYAPLD